MWAVYSSSRLDEARVQACSPTHLMDALMCRDKLVYDIGTIKLADFGLSKSLPYNKHAQYDLDETFKLTGETGSYRYMVCPRLIAASARQHHAPI